MQEENTLYTLIIFSENLPGLLSHVVSVFTRRQINIESLSVSASSIEGIHRYTITCYTDADLIEKITRQIERMIDVVQANYYTSGEIYTMDMALFKLSTPALLRDANISKEIRAHNGKIVEVNPTYSIVTMEGLSEEVRSLYLRLKELDCVLQYVRSGSIAVTRSKRELLTEYLDRRTKEQEQTEENVTD